MTSGLDSATEMAPIAPASKKPSEMLDQVAPASIVRHTPPPVLPM
jgi:hypothetical protein